MEVITLLSHGCDYIKIKLSICVVHCRHSVNILSVVLPLKSMVKLTAMYKLRKTSGLYGSHLSGSHS